MTAPEPEPCRSSPLEDYTLTPPPPTHRSLPLTTRSTQVLFLMSANLIDEKEYLNIVLISIFLIMSEIEYLLVKIHLWFLFSELSAHRYN